LTLFNGTSRRTQSPVSPQFDVLYKTNPPRSVKA
jgi:hypothetical protein